MRHDFHDRVSLEIARRIASELPERPEWLGLARENIERWRRINADAPGLLQCYEEWTSLLNCPLPQLSSAMVADTEEGQRLRQSSPFAGALPPRVIWEIKRRLRHETIAA